MNSGSTQNLSDVKPNKVFYHAPSELELVEKSDKIQIKDKNYEAIEPIYSKEKVIIKEDSLHPEAISFGINTEIDPILLDDFENRINTFKYSKTCIENACSCFISLPDIKKVTQLKKLDLNREYLNMLISKCENFIPIKTLTNQKKINIIDLHILAELISKSNKEIPSKISLENLEKIYSVVEIISERCLNYLENIKKNASIWRETHSIKAFIVIVSGYIYKKLTEILENEHYFYQNGIQELVENPDSFIAL
ncbi:hypothetical protein SteCoe_11631 [Stentor coeruleus]|uniref:Uncharacterized protein n=1 Tax=Stentor coeruleus TaxID=5963 RepID=A0A1R2CCP5_9CILI|nr:hypothetical protein SteCoe_11631 [Stentor coeruleus]